MLRKLAYHPGSGGAPEQGAPEQGAPERERGDWRKKLITDN
ncbi:hypothetical protein BFG60_0014 [Microcystis aeruginosa NIES-98]|nr:hypothetical protein BFG60_0014 [Microcystis aeruginosa NIES-98]